MVQLRKGDIALELDIQLQPRHRQRDRRRKRFCAFDVAGIERLPYRLLDFKLRIDADRLEQFAYAKVKSLFVNLRLLVGGGERFSGAEISTLKVLGNAPAWQVRLEKANTSTGAAFGAKMAWEARGC